MRRVFCDSCGEETALGSPDVTMEVGQPGHGPMLVRVEFTARSGKAATPDLYGRCRSSILLRVAAAHSDIIELAMLVKDELMERQPDAVVDFGLLSEALRRAFKHDKVFSPKQ